MEEVKYIDVKLVAGADEVKLLGFLNHGYVVLGMTSTVIRSVQHYVLLAKREQVSTKVKKPSKVKSKD